MANAVKPLPPPLTDADFEDDAVWRRGTPPADEDNPLESVGKAISAPVIESARDDMEDPAEDTTHDAAPAPTRTPGR